MKSKYIEAIKDITSEVIKNPRHQLIVSLVLTGKSITEISKIVGISHQGVSRALNSIATSTKLKLSVAEKALEIYTELEKVKKEYRILRCNYERLSKQNTDNKHKLARVKRKLKKLETKV